MFLHKLFLLKGEYVYLAGARLKNSDGVPELQILICYNRPQEAVDTYRSRWQIETLNRCLKTAGFNLEDTHLTTWKGSSGCWPWCASPSCGPTLWATIVTNASNRYAFSRTVAGPCPW